jgi:quinol monooxygenase YgiN
MVSVLEELFIGNIRPDAGIYPQDSPFVQAARVKHENLEKLMASLDDSEKELFEKYCEAQGDIEGITRYDTFTYALKFGILLMIEVFTDKSEITGRED